MTMSTINVDSNVDLRKEVCHNNTQQSIGNLNFDRNVCSDLDILFELNKHFRTDLRTLQR